jgi:HAD superfamily hydrolase (TIGR01549 family)
MPTRAIFFDVANTLLHKPGLYPAMERVLRRHGIEVPTATLVERHRLLLDVVEFPDRTSREFYKGFNSHVLRSLGASPTEELLDELFSACAYLPWAPFADDVHLATIKTSVGILSNWDASLAERLALIGDVRFDWVLGSAEQGTRKPNADFFQKVLSATGLDAGEIAYVGDSMRLDIEPALRLGMNAVLIDRDELYPHATVPRIATLSEIGRWI